MKLSIILAHPDSNSFNHAIADIALRTLISQGHHIFFHDLYEESFDPILPANEMERDADIHPYIEKYCNELKDSDGIIIVHPNWWGQPPAILKGWMDRVIRPGVAYEFQEGDEGEGVPKGLLKAQSAIVFNTSNTLPEREEKVFGDPLETIWKNCIFGLCGVTRFHRKMFKMVIISTIEQRSRWLEEVGDTVSKFYPKD
ncbi:MAG: NAD(P)H-dependent oxidoreductase [Deltaproteobacteria bacterium]|nr:NAD(P)H-dependent oxidoreductase [Deltaproteobacteria bacterium]